MSAAVPSTVALTTIADGAAIVASDHRNNYTSVQTAINALVAVGALATAKGDVLVATTSGTYDRLAVGTNGQQLVADSTQTLGVKWGSAGTNPPYFVTAHGTAASGLTANTAYYAPITVQAALAITSVRFSVAAATSGNYDIGIYDSTFAKLWSKGSTATPALGPVTVLISAGSPTSLTLQPGVYYLAFVYDNATAGIVRLAAGTNGQFTGQAYSKAASFPLPSSLSGGSSPGADNYIIQLAAF